VKTSGRLYKPLHYCIALFASRYIRRIILTRGSTHFRGRVSCILELCWLLEAAAADRLDLTATVAEIVDAFQQERMTHMLHQSKYCTTNYDMLSVEDFEAGLSYSIPCVCVGGGYRTNDLHVHDTLAISPQEAPRATTIRLH
jgi:hypothetical protein